LAPLLARAAELEAQDRAGARPVPAGAQAASASAPSALASAPQAAGPSRGPAEEAVPEGLQAVRAPMAGRLVELSVAVGDAVRAGQTVAVLEAMKMEHTVQTVAAGRVVALRARAGDQVREAQPLVVIEAVGVDQAGEAAERAGDPRAIRPDLQRLIERHALTLDAARPEAVARRHAKGLRTARENIADLCDPDS